jgi:hypothetical protein
VHTQPPICSLPKDITAVRAYSTRNPPVSKLSRSNVSHWNNRRQLSISFLKIKTNLLKTTTVLERLIVADPSTCIQQVLHSVVHCDAIT